MATDFNIEFSNETVRSGYSQDFRKTINDNFDGFTENANLLEDKIEDKFDDVINNINDIDANLNTRITNEVNTLNNTINTKETESKSRDSQLESSINELSNDVNFDNTIRLTIQEQIGTNIATDGKGYSLQSQIGEIKEKSDNVYPLQKQVDDIYTYVNKQIDDLPEPMVFRGTVGNSSAATVQNLPDDAKEGDTYKVIIDGTYKGQIAKIGDLFIYYKDGETYKWAYVPSADEPSGTVISIKIEGNDVILVDDSTPITTSGTRVISHKTSGVTSGKYNENTTATLSLGDSFKVAEVEIDKYGHIKSASDKTLTLPTEVDDIQQSDSGKKIVNKNYVEHVKTTLQSDITNLGDAINTLKGDSDKTIKELSDEISDNDTDISNINTKIGEVDTTKGTLQEQIDNIQTGGIGNLIIVSEDKPSGNKSGDLWLEIIPSI